MGDAHALTDTLGDDDADAHALVLPDTLLDAEAEGCDDALPTRLGVSCADADSHVVPDKDAEGDTDSEALAEEQLLALPVTDT